MSIKDIITNELVKVVNHKPYCEVADLLWDDPFIEQLANKIETYVDES